MLLPPFQAGVLGVPSLAITPANLLYNVVATPGALYRYWRQGQTGGRLALVLIAGTLPGVIAGSVIRVELLPGEDVFGVVVAVVLIPRLPRRQRHGRGFRLRHRGAGRGAGAYIAGEETALINSIEGKRAEPRNKPPFPAQSGLFGQPTAINNVETLLCVLEILRIGGPAFAAIGTENSSGTRLFCLSGCVEQPGLYEYEFGVTLRQVIEAAGGVRGGRPLRAVLLGGAAGSFVGPNALDTPLTFEAVREIGATLGSGVVLVLDDSVDLTGLLRRIAQFFRDESCGQCVPCRVGTARQEELLGRLTRGAQLGSAERELALLDDIAAVARDASICGLGQTAVSAAASAVKLGLIGANGPYGNGTEPT